MKMISWQQSLIMITSEFQEDWVWQSVKILNLWLAIKMMDLNNRPKKELFITAEIEVIKLYRHENTANLLICYYFGEKLRFVMEKTVWKQGGYLESWNYDNWDAISYKGKPEIKDEQELSKELKDFIDKCLEVEVGAKACAAKLLEHPFLKIPWL